MVLLGVCNIIKHARLLTLATQLSGLSGRPYPHHPPSVLGRTIPGVLIGYTFRLYLGLITVQEELSW